MGTSATGARRARSGLGIARVVVLVMVVVLGIGLVPGCGERSPGDAGSAERVAVHAASNAAPARIVSMTPMYTRMLLDLGAGDRLVGVATLDMAAPKGLTVVGNYLDVDAERLAAARPDLVLTATGKEGVSPTLSRLAEALGFEVAAYPYPATIEAVLDQLSPAADAQRAGPSDQPTTPGVPGAAAGAGRGLGVEVGPGAGAGVGEAIGLPGRAAALRADVERRLAALSDRAAALAGGEPPRVLLLFGLQPYHAVGPGAVHDELIALAGGVNAAGNAAVSAPTLSLEAIVTAGPDVVIAMLPDAPAQEPDDPRLAGLRALPIPASRASDARLFIVTDPLVLLPSTNLPDTLARLIALIHGTDAGAPDAAALDEASRHATQRHGVTP